MKMIGVIANLEKPRAVDAIQHVSEMARELGLTVYVEARAAPVYSAGPFCEVAEFAAHGVEAVVVLGGDGTMLDAARLVAGQNLPLMGLNIGSLGFLTSVDEVHFGTALRLLHEDRYDVSMRSTLSAVLTRGGADSGETLPDALNEVVVSREASGYAAELDLMLNDHPVARVLGDGIIVATPTGSTAYSLSAGGPILLPGTPAVVISMICPHSLTSRPLVVRDSVKITLHAASAGVPLTVRVDGRDSRPMQKGDTVLVTRSPRNVPLIELHGLNPCDVLRRKLGWGAR